MGANPLVLVYHKIERGFELGGTRLSPGRFERHLQILRASGGENLSLSELLQCLTGERERTSLAVHLTFDDGYASFEQTWTLCRRYGFGATIFPVAGYLGRRNRWDWVLPSTRHLDKGALRELVAEGVEVGAHTLAHPFLTRLQRQTAFEEIQASKALLEEILGVPVRAFAYPYGNWSPWLAELVAEAGFEMAFTTDPTQPWSPTNRFALPRTVIYALDGATLFRAKLGLLGENLRDVLGRFQRLVNRCASLSRFLPRPTLETSSR